MTGGSARRPTKTNEARLSLWSKRFAIGFILCGMMAGKKRSRKPEGSGDGATDTASQKNKKKRRPASRQIILNESIDCIASPLGGPDPIRTPVLSSDDRDILIDRLRKEVVEKFGFTLSRKVERNDGNETQGPIS